MASQVPVRHAARGLLTTCFCVWSVVWVCGACSRGTFVWQMQAYLQAYMTQMAGMQSVLTSLAGVKPPEGEGIKDDGKGGAAKAPADAAALLAGAAGAGGADALVPGYLQVSMHCTRVDSSVARAGLGASLLAVTID